MRKAYLLPKEIPVQKKETEEGLVLRVEGIIPVVGYALVFVSGVAATALGAFGFQNYVMYADRPVPGATQIPTPLASILVNKGLQFLTVGAIALLLLSTFKARRSWG